jgi:type I restriction enzyme S subunit
MKPWPTVRLGEVLTERRETPSPDDLAFGRVRIVSKISFDTGRIELRSESETNTGMILARPGDLVVSGINAAKGAIAVYGPENNEPIAATIHYGAYTPKPDRADLKFLWWFFRSQYFRDLLNEHVPGGIKTELKAKRLLPIPIPLPPLAEQRRVVARIEALAAQIHEARTLRHQAAEEAEALFDSFLSARFDSSDWPLKQLPEVAEVARGKFGHRPRNEPRFYGGEFPFIQIGDISNSGRYIRTHSQSLNKDGLAISRMFPAGTVAIAITGATIGVTGILGFDSCFPDSIVGIQARPESVTPEFIYLSVEHAKKTALAEATQTTQPNINLGNLNRLKVRVPPLAEQHRIVAELDALQAEVDALKRLQAETAAELEALLPAILDRASKGKI